MIWLINPKGFKPGYKLVGVGDAHLYSQHGVGRDMWISVSFGTSLVYKLSYSTARETQRNSVLKKNNYCKFVLIMSIFSKNPK